MSSNRVSVVGAGQIGYGLCVQFALVREGLVFDHRESNLEGSNADRTGRRVLRPRGIANTAPASVVESIEFATDLARGVINADVVLETVS